MSRAKEEFSLPVPTICLHPIFSFLFSVIPYCPQKVLERRGGRKEGRGGMREQEMADKERERERESETERGRERERETEKKLEREGKKR